MCPTLWTPWTAATGLPFLTNSGSLLKLMSIDSVMPSNHLILCCPLLLPPSIFPSLENTLMLGKIEGEVGRLINCQVHPLRAGGRQRARAPPRGAGGNGRAHPPPSLCVLGHSSLALGQRDQYVQTDGSEKGPPQSQHSWTPSGCADELQRLMGADSKEACLFEDLELLCECGGGWR